MNDATADNLTTPEIDSVKLKKTTVQSLSGYSVFLNGDEIGKVVNKMDDPAYPSKTSWHIEGVESEAWPTRVKAVDSLILMHFEEGAEAMSTGLLDVLPDVVGAPAVSVPVTGSGRPVGGLGVPVAVGAAPVWNHLSKGRLVGEVVADSNDGWVTILCAESNTFAAAGKELTVRKEFLTRVDEVTFRGSFLSPLTTG